MLLRGRGHVTAQRGVTGGDVGEDGDGDRDGAAQGLPVGSQPVPTPSHTHGMRGTTPLSGKEDKS